MRRWLLLLSLLSLACSPVAPSLPVEVHLDACRVADTYFDARVTVTAPAPFVLRLEYHTASGELLAYGVLGAYAAHVVAVHDGPGFDPQPGLTACVTADVDGERYASASCEVR